MSGDVFDGVQIPGVDDDTGLAMLVAHPCSMRRGAHVRDFLQMARVEAGQQIPLAAWEGNYGAMPLPDLVTPNDLRYRATFEMAGRVATSALPRDRRVACLSSSGVTLLLQRLAFSQTRVVVDLDTLHEAIAHVLEEADLLEEWLAARCQGPTDQLVNAIRAEEATFDEVMRELVNGVPWRQRLLDPKERAAVRRHVRETLSRPALPGA